MRYYVISDIHSFYTKLKKTLTEAGFFEDKDPHKLIVCGDLFDRGSEPKELQEFILDLMEKDQVILIRGNHEDIMLDLVSEWNDRGYRDYYFVANGTLETALLLTDSKVEDLENNDEAIYNKLLETPYVQNIIPATVNYFETDHYIFVHGWIPCWAVRCDLGMRYLGFEDNWREHNTDSWKRARWYNGMEAAHKGIIEEGKTIVCGHRYCSFGHCYYENDGEELGESSNFNPYYAKGIIAIDACTAFSGLMNCIVIED